MQHHTSTITVHESTAASQRLLVAVCAHNARSVQAERIQIVWATR